MKTVFIIYTVFLLLVFVLNGGITQASNQDSPTRQAAHSGTPDQKPGSNLISEAHHQ